MNILEVLAMGPQLQREARDRGANVNEAHLLVHDVMARALTSGAQQRTAKALSRLLVERLHFRRGDVLAKPMGHC